MKAIATNISQEFDTYRFKESKKLQVQELAETYGVVETRIVRKIDFWIIPPICCLYFVSFLNKASFGLYLMDGIRTDINCTEIQYMSAIAAFFVPYMVCQSFANAILKFVKPHFWISFTVFLYGCINMGIAFSKNYATFVSLQFFHGFFQAGTETGIYYILSHYYSAAEAQQRFSIIYAMNAVGGLCANLINLGCTENLSGIRGLPSWSWLCVIEASITIVTAIFLFFVFPDFPEGAMFLNDDESMFVVKKLEIYGGKSGYSIEYGPKQIWATAIDPVVFLPAFASLGISAVCYSVTFFENAQLLITGFHGTEALRRTCYSWICCFVASILVGFIAIYVKNRSVLFFPCFLLLLVGFTTNLYHSDNKLILLEGKYAGAILLLVGSYISLSILICWSSMNLVGHLRKSVGISMQASIGSLGALPAVYLSSLGKWFFVAGVLFSMTSFFGGVAYVFVLWRMNKLKRTAAYKERWHMRSERTKILTGDKSPGFDYMF